MSSEESGGVAEIQALFEEAHQTSNKFTIADIVRFLQETVGQKLVSHMAGVDPRTVERWAKGESAPRLESEQKVRAAFQIFHILQSEESPHTVRAWFIGMNPQLDDEPPADAIRDGRLKDVLVAAKAYLAGG